MLLLEDGAFPEQVDAALRAFGMAIGPFAALDMHGRILCLCHPCCFRLWMHITVDGYSVALLGPVNFDHEYVTHVAAGLDVWYRAHAADRDAARAAGQSKGRYYGTIADALFKAGRFGLKTRQGW